MPSGIYIRTTQNKINMSIAQKGKIGKKHTEEAKKKISESNIAEKNGMWRGDNVSYGGLHDWVKTRLPKAELCECCGKIPPHDLANKGIYDRNLENWEWLCRRCHMTKDGRMSNLKRYVRTLMDKVCPYCKNEFRPKDKYSKYCSKSCSNRGRLIN